MDNDWSSNPFKAVSNSSNSCVNRRTIKRCSPSVNDCKWDEVSVSDSPKPFKILAGPLIISARCIPPILLWNIRAKAPITENVPIVFWKKIRWSGVLCHKWCQLSFSFSWLASKDSWVSSFWPTFTINVGFTSNCGWSLRMAKARVNALDSRYALIKTCFLGTSVGFGIFGALQ